MQSIFALDYDKNFREMQRLQDRRNEHYHQSYSPIDIADFDCRIYIHKDWQDHLFFFSPNNGLLATSMTVLSTSQATLS